MNPNEKMSTKMAIFSHLSDLQEKYPESVGEINFVKNLILKLDEGKKQMTLGELNSEWNKFNK